MEVLHCTRVPRAVWRPLFVERAGERARSWWIALVIVSVVWHVVWHVLLMKHSEGQQYEMATQSLTGAAVQHERIGY